MKNWGPSEIPIHRHRNQTEAGLAPYQLSHLTLIKAVESVV